MNNNKITFGVFGIALLAVIYFVYTKFKSGASSSTGTGTGTNTGTGVSSTVSQVVETVEQYVDRIIKEELSEQDKMDAFRLADYINEDIKGINAHNMYLYDLLYKKSDAFLAYFVTDAWKKYSSKSFTDALRGENYRITDGLSKTLGFTSDSAENLISKILYKISNFKS